MSFHARHGGGGGSPHRGAGYPPSGSPPPRHYVEDDVEDNPFEQPTSFASRHYPPQQQDRHSQPQQFAPHRGGDYRSHSEPKGHLPPPHGPLSSSSSPSVSFHSNVRQGAPSPHSERDGRSPSHTQQQYHHSQPQHHAAAATAGKEGGSDGAGNIVPILLRRMDEMQRSLQQENQDLRQEVQQLRMMLQELLTQNNSPTRGASPTNGGYDSESSAAGGMRLKVDPNRRSCHLCRKEYNIQIAAQHFEGKTHKQQLRKLLDEQNWDELRRQAELARASGVVTTAEFYGRCANQRVEDHHYPHHQPSNSSARQPQQQYRSLSPHTHSHQQQYPPHSPSAAQDPHRAHHHHHSSSSPLHSSSHAAAGGGGSSFHPFAGFVSHQPNGGNIGAHRTAVGGGGSPSSAGGGYSPRSQY